MILNLELSLSSFRVKGVWQICLSCLLKLSICKKMDSKDGDAIKDIEVIEVQKLDKDHRKARERGKQAAAQSPISSKFLAQFLARFPPRRPTLFRVAPKYRSVRTGAGWDGWRKVKRTFGRVESYFGRINDITRQWGYKTNPQKMAGLWSCDNCCNFFFRFYYLIKGNLVT